ncbi:hypothetical protein [Halorussus amylolyticus]|uniref:hypothetical protein n=1 Tax=Halorussus amylolyticus TaxID=1126242 RepID=UPI0010465AD8|nr:hypothetical protein [Halorussus amylolyticus]
MDLNANGPLDTIREQGDGFGVMLAVLAVAFLAVGYAGGSVLAGEAVAAQAWVVPVLGALGASFAALSVRR